MLNVFNKETYKEISFKHSKNSIPYLIKFKYPYTYDYSITIPWLDNYTINGSIIVYNYEN